jgi:hypothetical protein
MFADLDDVIALISSGLQSPLAAPPSRFLEARIFETLNLRMERRGLNRGCAVGGRNCARVVPDGRAVATNEENSSSVAKVKESVASNRGFFSIIVDDR